MSERARKRASNGRRPLSEAELEGLRREVGGALAGRPEVVAAFLYGAAAEGRPYGQLYIGVCVDRERLPRRRDAELRKHLSRELGQRTGYRLTARVVNDAPLNLRYQVSCGLHLHSRSPGAAAEFRDRTWLEYFDGRPVALAYLRELS